MKRHGHGARTLLIPQASAYAGVCRRTVYYWIATGKVDWFRWHGSIRIYLYSLEPLRRE